MTDTNWINNPLQTKFQEVLFELHDLKPLVSNSAKEVLQNQTDKMNELEEELFKTNIPKDFEHTYFNRDEHVIISKNQTENFEDLIGAINTELVDNFNVTICYDKNDEFMNYPKQKDENAFSGFALLNQSETIYPEVKTSINVILDGWVDLKTQLKELLDKVKDEEVDFEEANNGTSN